MIKQLNIKITCCTDCPYADKKYAYEGLLFKCGHPNSKDKEDYLIHEMGILSKCPLSDAREQGVKVGVAIILLNEKNEFLVGRRDNATSGNDAWGLPGGGMDAGEKPKKAGGRELKEEADIAVLDIDRLEFATFTNDCFMEESGEHWITLYFLCRPNNWTGEVKRVEPHKCKEWRWVDTDNVPEPFFCDWAREPNITLLKKMIQNY